MKRLFCLRLSRCGFRPDSKFIPSPKIHTIMFITFLFLGLVLFGIAALMRSNPGSAKATRPLQIIGGAVIILGLMLSAVRQVEPGEVGVQTLFGKVQETILESGLNVVNPMVDVVTFNIKTQNYTMSSIRDEGEQSTDDAIRVLSKDGLEVVIDLTILYKALPAKTPEILSKIGVEYQAVVIRPMARTQIRNNAVYYDAVSLYSTRRDEFQDRIFKGIEKDFAERGIVLEELLVRNITLPESVKKAIESKINAEQEAQKMEFVLQKEMQEAERKRVEAQGISDYQKIMALTLTDKQLQYETIKANRDISLSPNTKIIIMGGKGNQPIMLNADK